MKDLADMARAAMSFKAMLESPTTEGGEQSPLSAIHDVVRILASIYEQLRLLNVNLAKYNASEVIVSDTGDIDNPRLRLVPSNGADTTLTMKVDEI